MDILGYFLAGGLAAVLWFLFGRKKKTQAEISPDIMPTPPGVNSRQRRRRIAGGFYPIGYTGPYLVGEELVDELMWMEELSDVGELDRGEFEDVQDHPVEDPRESHEFVTEPELVEEAPEAEEFEPLDTIPTPIKEASKAEEVVVPKKPKKPKKPKPAPEPTGEVIDESDVLNDELNRGWNDADDGISVHDDNSWSDEDK